MINLCAKPKNAFSRNRTCEPRKAEISKPGYTSVAGGEFLSPSYFFVFNSKTPWTGIEPVPPEGARLAISCNTIMRPGHIKINKKTKIINLVVGEYLQAIP